MTPSRAPHLASSPPPSSSGPGSIPAPGHGSTRNRVGAAALIPVGQNRLEEPAGTGEGGGIRLTQIRADYPAHRAALGSVRERADRKRPLRSRSSHMAPTQEVRVDYQEVTVHDVC